MRNSYDADDADVGTDAVDGDEVAGNAFEFRPRPQTVELHVAVAQALEALDRKVNTSNNIPTKALAIDLLTILLHFHQWTAAQAADLGEYATAVANSVGNSGGDELNEEIADLLADVHGYLDELDAAFATWFVGQVGEGQSETEIRTKMGLMRTRATELAERIEDALGEGDGGGGGVSSGDDDDSLFADETPPAAQGASGVVEVSP